MARKHFEVVREVEELRAEYHEKATAGDITLKEEREIAARIKKLDQEASDILTKGAVDCPTCGGRPVGFKRNRGRIEIGCVPCKNQRAESDDRDEAVENWNAGILSLPRVEDLKRCNTCKNINLVFTGPPTSKEFTVGCRADPGVVVTGKTAEEAIDNWNNSKFADANTPVPLPVGKAVAETAAKE